MQKKTEAFYILDADKKWAQNRIGQLEADILALGPEFHIAFNQSSETWHDNAPFDALRDKQSLMAAELQQLKATLRRASISVPKTPHNTVGIGTRVRCKGGKKEHTYIIVGNWSPRTGHMVDGALAITCISPLGAALLGTKKGSTVAVREHQLKIVAVQ